MAQVLIVFRIFIAGTKVFRFVANRKSKEQVVNSFLAFRAEKCGAACHGNSGDEAFAGFAGFSLPAVGLQLKLKVTAFAACVDKVTYCGAAACYCQLKHMVGNGNNLFPVMP